jgi:hypothetical protein
MQTSDEQPEKAGEDASELRDAFKWASAVEMLSLDVVAPFHGPMGLGGEPGATVASARHAVALYRELDARGPGCWLGFPARCDELFSASLPPRTAASLGRWIANTYGFAPSMLPQWFAWLELFKHFVESNANLFELSQTPRDQLYFQFLDHVVLTDVRAAADQARSAALSRWDTLLLAGNDMHLGASSDGPIDRGADILERVLTVVEMRRFQLLCSDWLRLLSHADLDTMNHAGAAFADSNAMLHDEALAPFQSLAATLQ